MRSILVAAVAMTLLASAGAAHAFGPQSLVFKKCAGCHAPGADGKLARVEEVRTTPEEWTVIVDRMRRLHGMPLKKAEMDGLLKELCSTQILTPEEQAKVAYLSLFHNSQEQEAPAGEQEQRLFATCVRCHSAGKIRSYRMTAQSWSKLRDFHLYVDPAVVYQMREMHWRDEAAAVLGEVAKAQPYGEAWRAPEPRLEGRWFVSGYEPGKGAYRGEVEIAGGADGEYRLKGALRYADRTSEPFEGEATLYGGYALRTRTRHAGVETRGAYLVSGGEVRGEHHFPAPRFRTSSSTWVRSDGGPRVVRVTPGFLLSGEKTALTLDGVDLPAVTAADVAFGGGSVKVLSAKRLASGEILVEAIATAPTTSTARLSAKGLDGGSVVLAPRIDHIAVTPAVGRARLSGGPHYPAEGVQFEAIAYAKAAPAKGGEPAVTAAGPDAAAAGAASAGVPLGPVPATFALAEEKTRDGDDDLRYAGTIAANGAYVPKGDYRPIPARAYQVEGSGLVKVVATYRHGPRTHRAQAQLAVTVPDYVQRIR